MRAGIERTEDRFVVHVRVHNSGDQTARTVNVVGAISSDGRTIEEASARISYVPSSWFVG